MSFLHTGHMCFNTQVLAHVFTFNPRISRRKKLLNYLSEKDRERIVNANTKILRIWAEIRVMLLDPDGMIIRTKKAQKK